MSQCIPAESEASFAGRTRWKCVVITQKKDADGFLVCDDLMPQKARILLMLAVTVTREREAIQEMFYRF